MYHVRVQALQDSAHGATDLPRHAHRETAEIGELVRTHPVFGNTRHVGDVRPGNRGRSDDMNAVAPSSQSASQVLGKNRIPTHIWGI